jgi:hypothetical protein
LLLIDKDEWRKLIHMSPDIGDAAALTCLERYTGDDPAIKVQTVNEVNEDEIESIMSEE